MTLVENKYFIVTRCVGTADQFDRIDLIAKCYDFDLGMENMRLYYELSPDGFYLLIYKESGLIVGFFIENHFHESFWYCHTVNILPQFTRKGGYRLLREAATRFYSSALITSENRNFRILHLASYGTTFGHKQVGFDGRPDKKVLGHNFHFGNHNISVRDALQDDLPDIIKYDDILYGQYACEKRRKFVEKWLFPSQSNLAMPVVAKIGSSLCGYGVARLTKANEWRFAPVYADSPEAGVRLLVKLFRLLPDGDSVYMAFPASKRHLMALCMNVGLELEYSEVRMYNGDNVPDLPIDKIYAEHEYWPV